jgi:hypothetical protein
MLIKRFVWFLLFPFLRWAERRYFRDVKRNISIAEVHNSVREFLRYSVSPKNLIIYVSSSKTQLTLSLFRYDVGIRAIVVCLTDILPHPRMSMQAALLNEGLASSVRKYEDANKKVIYLRLDFDPQTEPIAQALTTILTRTSILRNGELFDISIRNSMQKLDLIHSSDPIYEVQ